ncbi:MAG: leucyl aminopeptidase, partial [Bacteroidota bacterium]
MQFTIRHRADLAPEAWIVPVAKQENMEAALAPVAERTNVPFELVKADFQAGLKDVHTLYFTENQRGKRLYLLGLGEKPGAAEVMAAFRSFAFKRKTSLPAELGISFTENKVGIPIPAAVEAAVNGMMLGFYDIGLYKTEEKKESEKPVANAKVDVFVPEEFAEAAQLAIEKGSAFARTQLEIFDLVNAPANKKTPQTLADWAVQSGERYGYSVKIFEKAEIESLGLHALLAVNRGSENPPTFIVMEYL